LSDRAPLDVSTIQVRIALLGLALGVVSHSVVPLCAVIIVVAVLAFYSNNHSEEGTDTGGIS